MTGYDAPGVTMTPNKLFDEHMADMSEAELKVVLCAVRKTLGWHKQIDAISLSQFEKMTGLSRQAVITGIASAIQRGVLLECGTGKRGVKLYSLSVVSSQENGLVNNLDQSTQLTSTGQEFRPDLVKNLDTQKKLNKRNYQNKKDIAANAAQAPETTDELPVAKKPRSSKQLANDQKQRELAHQLGKAFGVTVAVTDEATYASVAKTLIKANIQPEGFQHYCDFWRNRAKQQGWTLTVRALTSGGRITDYLNARDKARTQNQQADLPPAIPGLDLSNLKLPGANK